jgi:hypothetical protein
MRERLFLIAAVVAALPLCAHAASGDWRKDAVQLDRRRIERLDQAWTQALDEARSGGHARDLAVQGALFKPDAALKRPQPAPGTYRCRTFKLGGNLPYAAYGWFTCRVELTPGGDMLLRKTTGSQRQSGNLYPDSPRRQIFLGAVAWGSEEPLAYRQNVERDQAGVLERIGQNRWRLALPYPKQESTLDVIELRK